MKIRKKIISKWTQLKESESCIPSLIVGVLISIVMVLIALHGCYNIPKQKEVVKMVDRDKLDEAIKYYENQAYHFSLVKRDILEFTIKELNKIKKGKYVTEDYMHLMIKKQKEQFEKENERPNIINTYARSLKRSNVNRDIIDRNRIVLCDFFGYLESANYKIIIKDKRKP